MERESKSDFGALDRVPLPIMTGWERGTPVPLIRDHRALLGNRVMTRAGFIFPTKEKSGSGVPRPQY
jgi:hypothetical protein